MLRIVACAIAVCWTVAARAEITKFTEVSAQPYALEQNAASPPYIRATADVEGALDPKEPHLATLDKTLIGADGRIAYKFQIVTLRPAQAKPASATLIVETEPETRPTAGDLLQIARQRNATMFFLSPAFENLPNGFAPTRCVTSFFTYANLRVSLM